MLSHDVLQLMLADHDRILQRVHRVEAAATSAARAQARQSLESELTLHLHAEEQILYDAARGKDEEANPLRQATAEHVAIELALTEFMAAATDGPAFEAKAATLARLLRDHLAREEAHVYPYIEGTLDPEARGSLCDAVAERKNELLMLGATSPPSPIRSSQRLPEVQRPPQPEVLKDRPGPRLDPPIHPGNGGP